MLRRLLAGLLLWSLVSSAGAADLGAIDPYVLRKMQDHLLPGLSLAVVRDGALVHQRGFGEMQPGSAIVIGSLSKAVTATAVLQLVDARKVDLDAPVARYLKELRLQDPAAAAITVRHLLNQTSGIPTEAPRAKAGDASLADHVAALRDVRLLAAPGGPHVYASPNYQVLGRLVEVVSGETFGAYVQRHVFAPLKMTSSGIEPGGAPSLVPGHNLWWGLNGPTAYRFEGGRLPTASLISTAPDLARFVLAHLNGGELDGARILSAESMATAHRGVGAALGFKYAMGWREGTTAGLPSLWHGGALPSYRGAIAMLPQSRTGVVVLANSATIFSDPTREIAAGVVALLNDRPAPAGFRPTRRTYLGIAALSVLLVGLQGHKLWKVLRGPRLTAAQGTFGVVALDLLLPVALVIAIPRFTHLPWPAMLEGAPDVVVTLGVVIALSAVAGVLKLVRRERLPGLLAMV